MKALALLATILLASGPASAHIPRGFPVAFVQAATPTFSPAAGTYSSAQTVTISDSTSGSTIYYTTDGSTPTTSSSVYSSGITVSTTTTVKAIATASGYAQSNVASATYTISSSSNFYVYQNYSYPSVDNGQNPAWNNDFSFGVSPIVSLTGSITSNVLTVTATNSLIYQGMGLSGTGVAATQILGSQLTGATNCSSTPCTYNLTVSQSNVSSEAMTVPNSQGDGHSNGYTPGNYQGNPYSGHTYSLLMPGGIGGVGGGAVWLPNADWGSGNPNNSAIGPFGFNLGNPSGWTPNTAGGPYTWFTETIYTAYSGRTINTYWDYLGNFNNGTTDQTADVQVDSVCNAPGITCTAGAWTTITFPLSSVGQLGELGAFKFAFYDNTADNTEPMQVDNVGFLAGGYSWIYDGGAPNSFNANTTNAGSLITGEVYVIQTAGTTSWTAVGAANNTVGTVFTATGAGSGTGVATNNYWNVDAATPINGWADATSGSITATYSFDPGTLKGAGLNNGISANGLSTPGYGNGGGPSTKAIEVVTTAANQTWKVTNSSGFTVSPYTYLTFAELPTSGTWSFVVKVYNTSGAAVGNAITLSSSSHSYTMRSWNQNGGFWTVWNIPISAFGTLPSQIGGVSIQDTSGLSSNTFYLSAVGFFY